MSASSIIVPDLHAIRPGHLASEHEIRAWALCNSLRPWCQPFAIEIVWQGTLSAQSFDTALWGRAHFVATSAKLWSLDQPWFDWWGVSRDLWAEILADNHAAAENLRTTIRRLAFARATGQQMLSAAAALLRRANIELPEGLTVEIVRKIAHGTLPRRQRGAVR